MVKIAIIGAGSHVFSRRLIADILTWPSLRDGQLALMDILPERVEVMTALAQKMAKQAGAGLQILGTTDLREALEGANYVVVTIRVGGGRDQVLIPEKYGVYHTVGDTMGPAGVFYFLRNGPAVVDIARTMQEVCPDALMLNYTNPMVMLCWALKELTRIRVVGLCHSVQGTAQRLAEYIGAPFEEVSYWAAGINHMAWFLEYRWKGKDAYPLIWKAMEDPEIYERDIVKWEILKHFGAFVTESSIHNAEYMPYFRRTRELAAKYTGPKMWGLFSRYQSQEEVTRAWLERHEQRWQETKRMAYEDETVPIERSHEYGTRIMNAIETNQPFVFNGNVPNTGLITNLPGNAVVEVPILADGCGLHPCYVGDLPPALAALNRSNLNVQELAVKGFVEKNREFIYRAIQLDPLTAAVLSLDEIRKMTDEMFEADAQFVDF